MNLQNLSSEVIDLLEPIYKLNTLIAIKRDSEELSMAAQYEHLRAEFYQKLKIALADIEIAAELPHLQQAA